ncbi:hypothetical protein FGO68_gene1397 [Halteria grandinella]|uniref:Uncharacterized protein n=1 Tax=Halteria grandinella TaxID=5974 RepID=A0A8J8TAL0_HALGN|nr:hypothetical protein FGO68_gene1397 [Halteria grandinella]
MRALLSEHSSEEDNGYESEDPIERHIFNYKQHGHRSPKSDEEGYGQEARNQYEDYDNTDNEGCSQIERSGKSEAMKLDHLRDSSNFYLQVGSQQGRIPEGGPMMNINKRYQMLLDSNISNQTMQGRESKE